MNISSARPADDIERVIHTYGNMLLRLSLAMLVNEADAEDAVQETAIRYMLYAPGFRDPVHEKAWLIRVASNICRDMLRYRKRHGAVELSAAAESAVEVPENTALEALCCLPEKYRSILLLHYVEGYSTAEIARVIGKSQSAVKMRLKKGRTLLEESYRKEFM